MFITAVTSARLLSLPWASSIHSTHPHPTYRRFILILSSHLRLGLPSGNYTHKLIIKWLWLWIRMSSFYHNRFLKQIYVYCALTEVFLNVTEVFLTLTEVSPCFFLSCKANARVKLAMTGHDPHSSTLVCVCIVGLLFVLFYVLFLYKYLLPPGDNPTAVNKYHINIKCMISHWIIFIMRNVSDKSVVKIKTHILCYVTHIYESLSVCEIM
jgi:hypothetical protein